MKQLLLASLLAGMTIIGLCVLAPSVVQAQSCESRIEGSVPDYDPGTRNPIICDTHGAQHVTIVDQDGAATPLVTSTTFGTNTAAAPTLAEASIGYFSWDLSGNLRVTLGTLLAGEDLTNNLLMTSGGAVRGTVGNVATAVATDTTSTAVALPTGTKTFYGSVDGTGSITQTQTIYGGLTSGVTATTGVKLCTLTLSGTTHDHAECLVTSNHLFYIVVTSATTGTGASGVITAMY